MVSVPTNRLKDDRYFTPTGAVRQLFDTLPEIVPVMSSPALGRKSFTMLDPSAGPGVFPMVARELLQDRVCITAVERNKEDVDYLVGHCEYVRRGNFFDFKPDKTYDLIVTNPPFSLITEYLEACCELVSMYGIICFLARTDWGQAEDTIQLLHKYPPMLQWRIGGRLSFKEDRQTDTVEYSWWIWHKTAEGPFPQGTPGVWTVEQLPWLPSADRKWKTVPGTERRIRL